MCQFRCRFGTVGRRVVGAGRMVLRCPPRPPFNCHARRLLHHHHHRVLAAGASPATKAANSTSMHHQQSFSTASPPPPSVVFSDHSLRMAQFLPLDDKLAVAAQLYRMGVNVCEAGFPAGSDDQYMAVHQIAKAVGRTSQSGRPPMQICAVTKPNSRERLFNAVWVSLTRSA